jgi:hypothetical protein
MSPWHILSTSGVKIGVNAPGQVEELGLLGTQQTDPGAVGDDLSCCCKPCDALYRGLIINLCADNQCAPGHSCNDAEFCLFILDFKKSNETGQKHWIFLKRANLNSSGTERDSVDVPAEVIEYANQGKVSAQCCFIEFLYVGAPFPSRRFIPTEYGSEEVDFHGTSYGPYKGFGGGQIEPRNSFRVHSSITQITIYQLDTGDVLTNSRFSAPSTKRVDVCPCDTGYEKDEAGRCVPIDQSQPPPSWPPL